MRITVLLLTMGLTACSNERGASESTDPAAGESPSATSATLAIPEPSDAAASSAPDAEPAMRVRSLRREQSGWTFVIDIASDAAQSRIDVLARPPTVGAAPRAWSQRAAGELVSAFATDLDGDNLPELLLWIRDERDTAAGQILGWRLVPYGEAEALRLPPLSDDESIGWRGNDQFGVQGRLLTRSYPLYRESDEATRPTGGFVRVLNYALREGVFVVEESRLEPFAGSPQAEMLSR